MHIQIKIYTEILEVNLFAFAYSLFHEDFSPIYEAKLRYKQIYSYLSDAQNIKRAPYSIISFHR